jgi:hypothetical protein
MHCNKKHRYSINQIWSGMLYGSKRADEFASLHSITIAYEHVWLTCTKDSNAPRVIALLSSVWKSPASSRAL